MIEASILDSDKLATISQNGKPPKARLDDARDARELVEQLLQAGAARSQFNAAIKAMFDGNPPYNTASLVKRGEGWRPNVNPMEGDAALSAAAVPYYDLFNGSMYYCEPKTYYGTADQQAEWNQTITEEFDCLLRDYEEFDYNVNTVIHDFVGFGKALVMWPDDVSWHFRHISHSRVKVRDRARASLSALDMIVILEDYSVTELWGSVKDRQTAEAVGWDVAGVIKAIREASPDELNTSWPADYESLQAQVNDHDLSNQYSQPVIRAAHIFVKEFSGKITHLIVSREEQKSYDRSPNSAEERFLFKKQDRYEKFQRALCPFFLETKDGSWNGAAGLGKAILSMIEIKTRLFNAAVGNAFLRASVLLQPKSQAALQKNSLVLGGGVTILPPDYEVINAQIFADMQGVMVTDRFIEDKLSNNTGIYRQKAEKPEGNPRTAEEVRLAYAQQAILGNSAVNRFYNQLDRMYSEVFRRAAAPQPKGNDCEACEAAREFQKRCTDRGVPIEALRKIRSVRACRAIGNGSYVMKQQALDHLIGIAGMFPEEGRANLIRDSIAAYTNQGTANRYFPLQRITDLPNDHEALAVLENAAMMAGSPVLVTGTQNHVIHATTHIRAVAQALNTLGAGADQNAVLNFADTEGPHIATHIQKLAQDPTRKNEVKGLAQQWKQLAGVADKLTKKVAADHQAAAEQQAEAQAAAEKSAAINNGVDPATQIEMAKTAAELKMKGEKHALNMAIKGQTAQQKAIAAAQDLAIRDAKGAAEVRATLATERKG